MLTSFAIKVIAQSAEVPSDAREWCGYLNRDNWDDWAEYCTQFYLTIADPKGKQHGIGQVKIGKKGLKPHGKMSESPPDHRKPNIPLKFNELGSDFFSVGQDDDYYANLGALGNEIREHVLRCLRDVAFDPKIWEWAKDEKVMTSSLLRSVTPSTIEGQFRRMAHGAARRTTYKFQYLPPKRLRDASGPFKLGFAVDPDSIIPTNVHVLIGRNGVGKTKLLSLMAKALVAEDRSAHQSGKFEFDEVGGNGRFANVVAISFSAFDEGDLLRERKIGPNGPGYAYIGLRDWTNESPTAPIKPKSPTALAGEFVESLKVCRIGAHRKRWENVISTLQSDPVFQALRIVSLIERDLKDEEEEAEVLKTFKELSSGHKIVLLTLTRLVEKVEEKTLVLIDEPEAHLHPPLLSAMTRAISELMVQRNGVTIVATHSPVILQEVPKSCVWIIDRTSTVSKAERPTVETFAESVGILTREVFQLELSQSGYHHVLADLRKYISSYQAAIDKLEGRLGAEGKAVLRGLYLND